LQASEDVEGKTGFVKHAKMLWEMGFSHLFIPCIKTESGFVTAIFNANKILVFVSFLFGAVYGLYKRQWKILVLLLFLLPYFWVHAKYPHPVYRFHTTIFAIVMLICIYGLCNFWDLIKGKLPRSVIILTQFVVSLTAITWVLVLAGYLPQTVSMSKASVSLPYIAILVVCVASVAGKFAYKGSLLTGFVIFALMVLMIVSNQFSVADTVGNGERDIEFKYLLDWYKANAKKGEKLVTTVSSILQIMAPQYKDCFIHTNTFDANNPDDFVTECYKRNITYVAWDSRMGLTPTNPYYKYWKMANIAPLALGKDIGPYQFITRLGTNQGWYINLYRLRYPPPRAK
jgi:hypothetical protein